MINLPDFPVGSQYNPTTFTMTFHSLKISCLCIAMTLSLHMAHGQKLVIGARDLLTVSVGVANPVGPLSVSNDPTLLANMPSGQTLSVRYLTRIKHGIFVGGSGTLTQFRGWTSPKSKLFHDTDVSLISLAPTIKYRTWSPLIGWKNKLVFSTSLSPGVSQINVETKTISEVNSGAESVPLQVKSLRFSIFSGVGISYSVARQSDIELSGGYQYTQSDSIVFPDASYSFWTVQLGLTLRLHKNKRYRFLE